MDQILLAVIVVGICLVAIALIQATVCFRLISATSRLISEIVLHKASAPLAEIPPASLTAIPQPASYAPASVPSAPPVRQTAVNLIGVDEETAAMLMAIVADEADVQVGELDFISIKKC